MSGTGKEQLLGRGMTDDEAERVLGRAAELMAEREGQGRHSRADVKAGAAEVGIDPPSSTRPPGSSPRRTAPRACARPRAPAPRSRPWPP